MKTKTITNILYNSFYQVLGIILPFVTAPYVSRILGAEGIGIYAYTYSIAGYFVLFEMLGVKNYGSRSCAEVQGNKRALGGKFVNIYMLQLLISIVCIVIYACYALCIASYKVAALFQIFYVFSGMIDISWFFFGIEKFKMTTICSTIVKISTVTAIFVFVNDPNDVCLYILIISISMWANQVALWPFLRREIEWVNPNWQEIKKHFKPNLILFIPVIAVSLYKIMDKIMLGNISTMSESGFYENAEKVINIPMTLITSLGTVMLPRMSNLAAIGEVAKSKEIIHKSFLFVLFLGSAMTFGILGIANAFIPFFYGEGFIECVPVVILLAPTIFFISWANVIRTQYLLPNKMDKCYIISVFAGAFVNLTMNICLIPYYGAVGAAIGTLCAEVLVATLQAIFVRAALPIVQYMKEGSLFLAVGVVMFVCVKLIEQLPIASNQLVLLIQVGVGVVVYCTLGTICLCKIDKSILIFLKSFARMKSI